MRKTMNTIDLKKLILEIVRKAAILKDRYTEEKSAPVNWTCIFSQSQKEYDELITVAKRIGKAIKETPTGLIFQIDPIKTISGDLHLLKIRKYDATRPEKGDADFTVRNHNKFKNKYLKKKEFTLIQRPEFEMVELMDKNFDVRAYFSHPTQEELLGIKNRK